MNIASSEFVIQIFIFFLFVISSFFSYRYNMFLALIKRHFKDTRCFCIVSLLNALLCDYWLAWSMIGKSHSKNFSVFDVHNATAFIGFLPYDNRDALFSDQPQSIGVYAIFFYNLSLLRYRMVPFVDALVVSRHL